MKHVGSAVCIASVFTDIESRMRDIREHGLSSQAYWPRGEGPEEYESLLSQWDRIYDNTLADIFVEFGEDEIADLFRRDRPKYDQLFESGRVRIFEHKNEEKHLVDLSKIYEEEAAVCAQSGAYMAACALVGAALETLLLLHCIYDPQQATAALSKLVPQRRPKSKSTGLEFSKTPGDQLRCGLATRNQRRVLHSQFGSMEP